MVDGQYSIQLQVVPVWTWWGSVSWVYRARLPRAILPLSDPALRRNHPWAPQWSQDQTYQRIRVWICFWDWNTCTEPCAVRGRYNTGAADRGRWRQKVPVNFSATLISFRAEQSYFQHDCIWRLYRQTQHFSMRDRRVIKASQPWFTCL